MNRRVFLKAGAAAAALPIVSSARGLAWMRAPSEVAVDPAALQQLLDESAASLGIVGAQLAVFDGEAVHEVATGLAVRERRQAVTTDTLFQIGSTTKVFNAAVVMALVDEGTLVLDEPVGNYLDGGPLTSDHPPVDMTLRQLLSMSSGLDNGPYTDHGRGDDALGQYVASLAGIPGIFEPGTAYGYSNAGTCVAGLAAQRVMGRNWEALLAGRILRPLGLEHSANFPEDLLYHPVALGYSATPANPEGLLVPFWGLPRSMAPAGATLCCSAGDLVRFAALFLRDGRSADGRQVLSGQGRRGDAHAGGRHAGRGHRAEVVPRTVLEALGRRGDLRPQRHEHGRLVPAALVSEQGRRRRDDLQRAEPGVSAGPTRSSTPCSRRFSASTSRRRRSRTR